MRRIVGLGVGALVLLLETNAAADGERTPMFGATVAWETSPAEPLGAVGVGLEAAWWFGAVGIAVEGSGRSRIDDRVRAPVLGASVRLRVFDSMVPSLIDAREEVELGLELQGLVEHTWLDRPDHDAEATRLGVGAAVRLRGSGDSADSTLIAESRLFVRVLTASASADDDVTLRTMTPPSEPRVLTVMFGLGASFGVGEAGYLERFRRRPPLEWAP